jgi:hypothetical protein
MKGWHSRGYLPHFDGGEIYQFITLHLGDALPQTVIKRWKLELEHEKDKTVEILLLRRIQKYLDQGYGSCYLRQEKISEQVQESLLHFDTIRYRLIAWVVMPNHSHFLIMPINNWELSDIMQKYKSYTSHECNKALGRQARRLF